MAFRITRYNYPQDHYVELMFDAFKLWDDAEQASSMKVFTRTGGLDFGKKDNPSTLNVIENAKKFNIEHEVFQTNADLQKKFPMLNLQPGWTAIYSPAAGILNATKAVSMFQQLCRSVGCQLLDNTKVTAINKNSDDGLIIIETENGKTFRTKKCIVTVGAWAKKVLKNIANLELPLNPIQVTIAYWKVNKPEQYHSSNFPVFISYDHPLLYGTPCHEFSNLIKCAAHCGPSCDPDNRTFDPGFDKIENDVSPWLQQVFTGVSKTPQMTESCMYTETPDSDYVVDIVPGFPGDGLLVGCGFSGHGFKLAPVVGRLLARWALSGKFPYDQRIKNIFSMKRFEK